MADLPDETDLLTELASRLSAARGGWTLGPVDLTTRTRLLSIARDVAHATERQNAPLAAYLVGRFIQGGGRLGHLRGRRPRPGGIGGSIPHRGAC